MPSRHVRTVRLNAPSEPLLRRGAILLEDALHTASLPEAEGGRLLLVRSLNVGNIHSRYSSASLALTVEKRLWQLGATAIHAEDPAAKTAPAVYFRDDAEAYICLAARLARQANVDAWFWSLAVPEWQPNLPRDEALRRLVRGVSQTRSGVTAVVALISELLSRGAIAPLLAALTWQDGLELLRVCGWYKPDLALALVTLPPHPIRMLPAAWNELLAYWSNRWGAEDARLVWLAAVALVSEKSVRLLDAELMYRSQQVIKQAISGQALAAIEQLTSSLATSTSPVPDAINAEASSLNLTAEQFSDIPNTSASTVEHSSSTSTQPTNRLDTPQPTANAGLFFLLPLLNRLGIATFLESHPHLLEVDLPRRLLHTLAQRLSISTDDPMWAVLTGFDSEMEVGNCEFIAPQEWGRGVWREGVWTIQRRGSEPNSRVLLDSSGRLVLALWRGKYRAELRTLIGENPLKKGSPVVIESDLTVLVQAWITAMRRWCRRYAGMGLHDLVCRPGRVLITRTHVDILFNHQQADLRIRRVGLDLDPGWIPWFGRVVAFHYLYREEVYGVE